MLVLYAVLPLVLSLGVSAQAAGIYCAGLVPAFFLFRARKVDAQFTRFLNRIGLLIIAIWAIFPLSNLFQLLFSDAQSVAHPSLKDLLTSRMSSAFLVSALVLLGVGALGRRSSKTAADAAPLRGSFWVSAGAACWWFLMGATVASVLLGVYLWYQAFTGFEYRAADHLLLPEHRMPNGMYRVFGFYGHPLRIAGTGVAWFAFAWSLLWALVAEKVRGEDSLREALRQPRWPWSVSVLVPSLFFVSLAQFSFVVLSGGRTALIAAMVLLIVIPFCVKMSFKANVARIIFVLIGVLGAGAAFTVSGIAGRFADSIAKMRAGEIVDDRFSFWFTHLQIFKANSFLGAGHAWLDAGLRKNWYQSLGFLELAVNKDFNAHNLYLETLADVGLFGALLIVGCVSAGFWVIWKTARQRPLARAFFIAVIWAFVSNLLHGFTENTYFASNIALVWLGMFWTLLWSLALADTESA
jgi:O-antigen ligase